MEPSQYRKPAVLTGCLLSVITFLKAWNLRQGGGLIVGACFLLLASLALFLLYREGLAPETLSALLLPVALALFIRIMLIEHVTLDYENFLQKWVEHFRQCGGFAALKDPVGNYNVPYLYLLAFLSYLPISDLYGIKLFSILFDILLAWGGFRLARHLSSSKRVPLYTFNALLLLPTVILNGSAWGQCDSIWAALCVHALACAMDEKPKTSLALLSLAFSFKLQSVFIIPLWCVLWFTEKVKFRHFTVFPAVFAIAMAPALLVGKPLKDILSIYLDQAGDSMSWQTLNYNSPSIFAFLPYQKTLGAEAPKIAILAAFLLMCAILTVLFWRRRSVDNTALVLAGAALALGIPFLLPYMHERYFFLGVVLLVVLACASPRCISPAAGAELASLGGYHAYLLNRYVMVFRVLGLTFTQPVEGTMMLFAVLLALSSLWQRVKQSA